MKSERIEMKMLSLNGELNDELNGEFLKERVRLYGDLLRSSYDPVGLLAIFL